MGHVTLTIAEIRRPGDGKDRGNIIGIDGKKFGCFREKLAMFSIGNTYDIELSDGQYQNVRSAKLIAAAGPPTIQPESSTPQPNGHGNGNGYYRPTSPVDAERMFVTATLGAFIKAGKIEPELGKVTNAITVLRQAYQRGFAAAAE
jgi:hypothetical protein